MVYDPYSQVGAPRPSGSLFGGGGTGMLGALQGLMGGGLPQPQQAAPAAASPVSAIKTELATQMSNDPIAQQHTGDPDYEELLKAELLKQLQMDADPSRAISRALAAAGSAISGGKDVWGGITEGVNAYHTAREGNPSNRISALTGLVSLDRAKAAAPLEAEAKRMKIEVDRSRIELNRARARGQKDAGKVTTLGDSLKAEKEVAALLEKEWKRLGLDDNQGLMDEEARALKEQAFQEYAEALRERFAPLLNQGVQGSATYGGSTMTQGEIPTAVNPNTGERLQWNGTDWIMAP